MRSARIASIALAGLAALASTCHITLPPIPWPPPSPPPSVPPSAPPSVPPSTPPSVPPSTPPSVPPSTPPSVPPSIEPSLQPTPPPPSPPPTPPPCVETPIPAEPVLVDQPAGACTGGASRFPFAGPGGGTVCLVQSECPWPAERCIMGPPLVVQPPGGPGVCQTVESSVNYNAKYGRVSLDVSGLALYHDGPRRVFLQDAYGRVYPPDGAPVRPFGDWTWVGPGRNSQLCPPRRTTCPSPLPSTLPSIPPSPGPSPSAGPTPAPPCPPLVAVASNVAQHQTPQHATWPHPWGLVGGTTNTDSTPKFLVDRPRAACNQEHHSPCTLDGDVHQHTLRPDPDDPSRLVCVTWRHCEDPRGPAWSQVGGPAVQYRVENGDGGRGYGLNIGPFTEPGEYRFRVCAPQDWRDAEGYAVPVQAGACSEVGFEVR